VDAGPKSLIAELRAATASVHRELDQRLDLLTPGVTHGRYLAFLQGSLSALEPLENSLAAIPVLEAVPHRARSSRLRADLAALGANPVATPAIASLRLVTSAAACGARYVIEGSALGGAVLARGLAERLALTPDQLGYLTLYGDDLAEHWRAFVTELTHWSKSATLEMRSEACDTARAVFESYRAAFERAGALVSHR